MATIRWRPRVALLAALLAAGCTGAGAGPGGTPGLNVAEAALRGGSAPVALQVASGILARDPDNAAALAVQGEALTLLGRMEEAEASFTRALRADPASVRARIGLGRLRLATDPAAAETLFLDVLQRDPRDVTALNDLGIARDLQRRHADAQAAYRQALGVSPDLRAAQVNLALSLAMSGRGDDALRIIRPLANEPGATRKLRHDYAAVLAMTGRREEAERILASDLSPAETRQALAALAEAGGSAGAAWMETPAATPVANAPVQVQLAALPSEDAAHGAWQRLQERLPEVLAGYRPLVASANESSHPVWRLRVAGFADADAARRFCAKLRAAGAACALVTP